MVIKLGVHVSISGGISNSVSNATSIGCSAFQIFTRSPRQWSTKEISLNDSNLFKEQLKKSGIDPGCVVVHMPYLPNLSAPNSPMYDKSVNVFMDEIKRCDLLGIKYLVIHLGSHLGDGKNKGISQLVNACNKVLSSLKNESNVKILLENSAGQKNSIGSKVEEITEIYDKLEKKYFGLCVDTCHLFASGYDLSKSDSIDDLIQLINSNIGIKNLKLFHLNDSKGELGSNLDRHYHIGLGKIGIDGLRYLINNEKLKEIPFIMETPVDNLRKDIDNIQYVKNLVSS